MKTKTVKRANFLELGFGVAHACPKSKAAIDYTDFLLDETYEDQYIYRCPVCQMTACIDVYVHLAAKPKRKRKEKARVRA